MKKSKHTSGRMRKYHQLILVIVCCVSVISLLIYRHEYYRLRYVLEVLNFFGKPGLSEIEFCGAGFNATLLTELLVNSSHSLKETPPLFQQIDENFYTYSSFVRHNPKYEKLSPGFLYETDTIAVGKSNIEPSFRCNLWFEDVEKPKSAKFTYKTVLNDDSFKVHIFRCATAKDFGQPTAISFYSNDPNTHPYQSPISQLIPINAKKGSRENASIKFINNVDISACVIPNIVPLVTKSALIEFLTFHQMMGVEKFTVYDSTVSEEIIKHLNMLPDDISKWNIKFFPLNYPFLFSKSYGVIRKAIELDCTFRNLQIDKEVYTKVSHLVTLSWDEFIVPRYHHTLKALLREFNPIRKQKKMDIACLNFCLNQPDDDKVNADYPSIVKKTTYYKIPNKSTRVTVINLDSVNSFEQVVDISSSPNKTIPEDVLSIHKYSVCSDGSSYNMNGEKLGELPHKFEGAMLKFADDFQNNKVYRLYKTGRIWDKSTERIHDAL